MKISNIYKNMLWIAMAAMIAFAAMARGAVSVWSITPVLLAAYGMVVAWLVASVHGPWSIDHGKIKRFNLLVAAFAILAIISAVFSIYKHASIEALLRLFAYIGIYYLIVNEFDHSMRKRVVYFAIFLGAGLSAYGLSQYFGFFGHSWWHPPQFLAATFVNHNHFAGLLELIIPVAIALLVKKGQGDTAGRLCMIIALVVMVSAFVLTQSRGAWISLGISALVMVLIMLRRAGSKKNVVIIMLLAASSILFIYVSKDVLSERLGTLTRSPAGEMSMDGRVKMWKGALEIIRDNPLAGTGIGTFAWAFPRYRPEGFNMRANFAHNDYLNMAAEMGVVAPVLMLLIFFILIRAGLGGKRANPYAFGCAIGILSLALHGSVDFNFHIPSNMILFTVWCAIIIKEHDVKRT